MSNKKKISFIALVSVLVGCFNTSYDTKAQWITSKISSHLDLNESQEIKLNDLKDTILKAKQEASKEREERIKQMREMVTNDRLDKTEIKNLLSQRSEKFGNNIDPILDKLVDFHSSLNIEQKQKIADFMDEYKGRYGHWGHHHPW